MVKKEKRGRHEGRLTGGKRKQTRKHTWVKKSRRERKKNRSKTEDREAMEILEERQTLRKADRRKNRSLDEYT